MQINIKKSIYGIFICLLLSQCSTKEVKVEYYNDGVVRSKTDILDGVKDGIQYVYYPSGKIQSIHHFKNDTIFGVSSYFRENGKLSKKVTYSNNKKEGPYEFFFNNGNIAESGNFVSDNKRGKIWQYFESDSGKLKNEMYSLDFNNNDYTYYIKRYDLAGNVISVEQPLKVLLPNDTLIFGESSTVKFRFENIHYDSAIIVLGDFDDPTFSYNSLDTVKFIGKEAQIDFAPTKRGYQPFRGQWIVYEKTQDADSVYEYTTFGLFEERVYVK